MVSIIFESWKRWTSHQTFYFRACWNEAETLTRTALPNPSSQ